MTINDIGHVYEILCNWPESDVKVDTQSYSLSLSVLLVLSVCQWACQFTQPMSIADARLHSSAAVGWQRCYLTLPQWLSILFVNKLKLVK